MTNVLIEISYLVSSVLFIWGLKDLSSPTTARRGNFLASFAMFLAVAATLFNQEILTLTTIFIGVLLGGSVGALLALKIQMTAMPQMVALLNGFGGAASALVGMSEYFRMTPDLDTYLLVTIGLSTLIGWLTLTGSLVAFAKLQELMPGAPMVYPMQNAANGLFLLATLALIVYLILQPAATGIFILLAVLAGALGVLAVLPIGGADMPVVIALLNSFSGIAAAATGFVIQNNVLIISGSLVGSSGAILSYLMCVAMNRSLANVLFGAFGHAPTAPAPTTARKAVPADGTPQVRQITVDEAAEVFRKANRVIIVPGYGMAAAQAQHAIRELADLIKAQGSTLQYAIHPVAGRMPGHMNVLLAEANVPYDELVDMDDVNPDFPDADVALVMGANDVTNPAARHDTQSPIYGMPILDVDKAKMVIVCKRSMKPGFAGIDNELYTMPNTQMLFGDAKSTAEKLVDALKQKKAVSV